MTFHEALTRGIEVRVEHPGGRIEHRQMYTIDWDRPEMFELKNPWDPTRPWRML